MTKIKNGKMFATYHIPMKKRNSYPPGAYYAIMPRPLYRDTEPIAVVIQELDAEGKSNIEPPFSPPQKTSTETTAHDEYHEELVKDSHDFRQRHSRVKQPFIITSPALEELCRVDPDNDEGAHYVYAPDGILLASIHKTPGYFFPWPHRTRWHMEVASSNKPYQHFSAPKGTMRAWASFAIFSPLWAALALFGLLAKLLAGIDAAFVWDFPARTKWRTGFSRWGLDFHGVGNTYYINTDNLEHRVAYAQAIIHSWSD